MLQCDHIVLCQDIVVPPPFILQVFPVSLLETSGVLDAVGWMLRLRDLHCPCLQGASLSTRGCIIDNTCSSGWDEQSSGCHAWKDWYHSDRWSVPLRECWKTRLVGCVVRRALVLDFWDFQIGILGKVANTNLQKLKSRNVPFAYHQAILRKVYVIGWESLGQSEFFCVYIWSHQ